ncbi:hypothetical protein Gotur_031140, partial [Gossypium turneri]
MPDDSLDGRRARHTGLLCVCARRQLLRRQGWEGDCCCSTEAKGLCWVYWARL